MSIGYARCSSCHKSVQRCTGCGAFLSVVAHDHRSGSFLCVKCVSVRHDELKLAGDWQADRFQAALHPVEDEPDPDGSTLMREPASPHPGVLAEWLTDRKSSS